MAVETKRKTRGSSAGLPSGKSCRDFRAGMRAECIPRGSGLNRTLEQVEAEHIRLVLDRLRGNKSRAAKRLGIDRKTLREKLKRFGLAAEEWPAKM